MLLGVHCSVSGGVVNAFSEAGTLGIDTFQIFTKNQRQWKEKQFEKAEADIFRETQKKQNVKITFSHSSYLINLASGRDDLLQKSTKAITGELQRCHDLGLAFTVLHPGSGKDRGEPGAIESIAAQLKQALSATSDSSVKVLLENMAGQGQVIGKNFEQLRQIYDIVGSNRIGFCYDTCHAFAAGYDIRTKTGFEDCMAEWDKVIGLERLNCLHLNDSKGDLGSNLDRHEHIGHGKIGDVPFREIMQRFPDIPKVIETPKVDDWDATNIKKLRSFV